MQIDQTRRNFLRIAGVMTTVAVAGCIGSGDVDGDATPTPEPTLSIAEFVFCDGEPSGYDDYTVREDATYAVDETVWVYLDVLNLGSESVGEDRVTVDLAEILEVSGPSGETVLEDTIEFDNEFPADADLQTFFLVNDITLPTDASAGDYQVAVTLEDRITGESTTRTKPFTAE